MPCIDTETCLLVILFLKGEVLGKRTVGGEMDKCMLGLRRNRNIVIVLHPADFFYNSWC